MNFGEQIKSIRETRELTQEQFAEKLHVSRQAVSNWENDKNLPDIGLLILMSDVFEISLDQLIKGDQSMNNMTEKIIKDGSETRRSRFNMITTAIGASLLLLGILLLAIKAMSVEYVDDAGYLHENFFLLPCGFLCLFGGVIAFLAVGVKTIADKVRKCCEKKGGNTHGSNPPVKRND